MNQHLYRSRDDRMLAGVAGGLAELWDADPSLVRIIWALLVVLTGGIALVVYVVMAIVVPDEDEVLFPDANPASPASPTGDPASTPIAAAASPTVPVGLSVREQRRIARREARAARRAERGREPRTWPVVMGVLLILVGVWYLVREYLPTLDWDWFWPASLVALGCVILAFAVRPRRGVDEPTSIDRSAGA